MSASLHKTGLRRVVSLGAVLAWACLRSTANGQQTADDYFHSGAGQFIQSDHDAALTTVTHGLSVYPQDFHLLALKQVLDQQSQPQQPDQPQQDQQEQEENQDQQNQQNQQAKQDQEGQENTDQQDQEQESRQEEPQPDQQAPSPSQTAPAEASSEEMTPEEAAMLLDAMKQEELANRRFIELQLGPQQPVEKDW